MNVVKWNNRLNMEKISNGKMYVLQILLIYIITNNFKKISFV